jgi:hypothetical protein
MTTGSFHYVRSLCFWHTSHPLLLFCLEQRNTNMHDSTHGPNVEGGHPQWKEPDRPPVSRTHGETRDTDLVLGFLICKIGRMLNLDWLVQDQEMVQVKWLTPCGVTCGQILGRTTHSGNDQGLQSSKLLKQLLEVPLNSGFGLPPLLCALLNPTH